MNTDTTSIWLSEIVKLGMKSQFSTVPEKTFNELKEMGLVEGVHLACKPTGKAYLMFAEKKGKPDGAKTNKRRGAGSRNTTKVRKIVRTQIHSDESF